MSEVRTDAEPEGDARRARTRCRCSAACRARCSGSRARCAASASTRACVAPCDGPPPEPGITTVGPSTRLPQQRLGRARSPPGEAVARRTLEAIRAFAPDVLHLHEPLTPGANHAALMGTDIPAVGTFHSARAGRNGWYETLRSPLQGMVRRLAVRTAVSAEAQRQVEHTFGSEVRDRAERHRRRRVRAADAVARRRAPRSSSWVATSAARASRCCSRRSTASSATRCSGSRATGPRRRRCGAPRRARAWSGSGAVGDARSGAAAGRHGGVLPRRSTGSPSASSCSRRWLRARPSWRPTSRVPRRRSCRREALLVPPGDPRRCAERLRRLLADPRRRAALVDAGRARADEFSMDRLADTSSGSTTGRSSGRRCPSRRQVGPYDRVSQPCSGAPT